MLALIHIEKVTPVRYCKDNIIICNRKTDLQRLSSEIAYNVHSKKTIGKPQIIASLNKNENDVYGIYLKRQWFRAMVKFTDDNTIVLHLLDCDGVYDFHDKMTIRIIDDPQIIGVAVGQIKMFVYAAAPVESDQKFKKMFEEKLLNKEVTAVFGLVEEKNIVVHESYAGDFVYEINGKPRSFRELLIRNQILNPCRVSSPLNQMLFIKITELLVPETYFAQVQAQSLISDTPRSIPYELFGIIDNRFEIYQDILGEGSVRFISILFASYSTCIYYLIHFVIFI